MTVLRPLATPRLRHGRHSLGLVRRVGAAFVVTVVGASLLPLSGVSTTAASTAGRTAHEHPSDRIGPPPLGTTLTSDGRFSCQKPNGTKSGLYCYGPAQVRAAYGIQQLLDSGQDGSGRTVVIVDAFQDPTVAKDLKGFDTAFGLAPPPSFQLIDPF